MKHHASLHTTPCLSMQAVSLPFLDDQMGCPAAHGRQRCTVKLQRHILYHVETAVLRVTLRWAHPRVCR